MMITLRLPREEDYHSPLHHEGVAARVGLWLGIAFGICFITGMISHLIQHPPGWFVWPAGPSWLYRVTQGLHVTTGIASIPLLGVKLWVVMPKFWRRPLIRGLVDGLERLSILILIGACAFQLLTGLANVAEVYAWSFFFPRVHYAVAWIAIGAIIVHVALKLPVVRRAMATRLDDDQPASDDAAAAPAVSGLSRRGLLGAAATSAALAAVLTAGDTAHVLRPVSVLAQRSGAGPKGLPVNRTARAARITVDEAYHLSVTGEEQQWLLTLPELQQMAQHTARLPIACVEGWSQQATWTGVRLTDVIIPLGATPNGVRVVSPDRGPYGHSVVADNVLRHPDTLLALRLNGEILDLDHGYPVRLIAPNRPGAMQTKWVDRIELIR